MRIVIQRVTASSVEINQQTVAKIQTGLLVLLGVEETDSKEDADWLIAKLIQMRIFSDEFGKMNLSLIDVGGELLIVSQFTLFASTKKGNRPGFVRSAAPEIAIPLYEYFIQSAEERLGRSIEKGVFGADMKLNIINDGPVTILMDSKNRE